MIIPRDDARAIQLMPPTFDVDYVEGAVKPFFLSGEYTGERPSLPLIDLNLSKEKAVPVQIWGMLYDGWAPNMEEDGLSVFLQGYEHRGPHNERKKIYASATTPDLYAANYADKVTRFFERLFADANAGQPLMHQYYANYFDLYWDLHLGVKGDAVPPRCGSSARASTPSSASGFRPWMSSVKTTCACASCASRSRTGSMAACRR
jgi:hypothetical protein